MRKIEIPYSSESMHGPSNSGFSHSGLKGYSAEKESFPTPYYPSQALHN